MSDHSTDAISERALLWGLKRLCLWGELDGVESADPHVRGEAAYSAKTTLEQIAWDVQPEHD
jgi:hypothetical protein